MKKIIIPYKPRDSQMKLHNSLKRFNVIVAHRRFGKTVFAVNELIKKVMTCNLKRPQYAYIAPTQKQAKLIAWAYVKEFTATIPGVVYNEAELRCDFPNGGRLFVLGAENPDSLRGLYLDGVVLDEVAQMPVTLFGEVIRPALSDRKGWAIFIGTPKGRDMFYDYYHQALSSNYKDWFGYMIKASESGLIDDDELLSLRSELTDGEYNQEFECSFDAAIKGAYYGKLIDSLSIEKGIGNFPYSKENTVITAWDLGLNDATVIWFAQQINGVIHIIDYYINNNQPLTHYVNLIKSKPYVYDYHIMPHDVKQRNFSTGTTRLDELIQYGLKCVVAKKLPIFDGINAVSSLLPSCRFHVAKVSDGLESLKQYRSNYNDKLGVQQQVPLHDKHSHAADAFRYLAVGLRKVRKTSYYSHAHGSFDPLRENTPQIISDYDPLA